MKTIIELLLFFLFSFRKEFGQLKAFEQRKNKQRPTQTEYLHKYLRQILFPLNSKSMLGAIS